MAILVLGGVASADPVIEVRGRMRIELDHVERHERALTVSGRLLDEVQNEPMGGWTIALRAGSLDADGKETFVFGAAMPADVDGNFTFRVAPVSPSRYVLHLTAPGDTVFTAAAPIDREVDLGRRAIELRLFVPAEQPARALTLPISVEAVGLDRGTPGVTDASSEEDLAVNLELDGVATATLLLSGGRAETQLALPRVAAGRELVLRARFAGDATRSPAEATQRVRLVEDSMLTLLSDTTRAVAGSEVVLRGHLTFGDRGIGGLPVAIHSITDEKETVALVVTTDPSGAFEAKVRTPLTTRAAFEAHFAEAEARSLPAARSELLVVELNTGFSLVDVGSRPAGNALAVAGLLIAALALLRVGAWLAPRRQRTAAPAVPGAQRPRATLRSQTDRRVSGRVLDSERAQPLSDVRVTLTIGLAVGEARLELATDARGTFDFADVVDGSATLVVTLAGFAPLLLTGKIPHRGEWTAVDLRLVPLRAEILRLYGAALAPYVPGGAALGLRTPRELARAARFVPGPAVAALRRLVEDSCYGPAGASEAALSRIQALLAELSPPQSNQS